MGDENENNSQQSDAEQQMANLAGDNNSSGNDGQRPDGVPDKFWDEESKTVKHDDVLKSYTELESKFGSFTGSPDEFDFNVSEEMTTKLKDLGVELDVKEDPLYQAAVKMAKDTNMNQEGFNQLADLYLMTQVGNAEAEVQFRDEQMQQLGERAEARVSNIEKWGEKNLDPELFQSLKSNLVSADMVPVLEHLITSTRNAPVSDSSAANAPSFTESDLSAMQFEKDSNGNRKIQTDPAFKAKYQKMMKEFYGDSENKIIVG